MRDLETQAEDERKQRSSATSAMKKLEADLAELESQRDLDARGRDDAYKQYKKLQVLSKWCMSVYGVLCSYTCGSALLKLFDHNTYSAEPGFN